MHRVESHRAVFRILTQCYPGGAVGRSHPDLAGLQRAPDGVHDCDGHVGAGLARALAPHGTGRFVGQGVAEGDAEVLRDVTAARRLVLL